MTEGKLKAFSEPQKEHLRQLAEELDKLEGIKDANEKNAKATEDYKKLLQELNKEDGLGLDQARERLKILNAGAAAAVPKNDDEFVAAASKAIDGIGGTDRNSYKGPDALYGGASGEFGKIDSAVKTENEDYAAQLQALNEERQARADLNAEWDAKEEALATQHKQNL